MFFRSTWFFLNMTTSQFYGLGVFSSSVVLGRDALSFHLARHRVGAALTCKPLVKNFFGFVVVWTPWRFGICSLLSYGHD